MVQSKLYNSKTSLEVSEIETLGRNMFRPEPIVSMPTCRRLKPEETDLRKLHLAAKHASEWLSLELFIVEPDCLLYFVYTIY